MQLFKGSYFTVGAAQDISDLIRLSQTIQRTYVIIYEFCFICFKVEYRRPCISQSSSSETIIHIYIHIDFNSEVCDL